MNRWEDDAFNSVSRLAASHTKSTRPNGMFSKVVESVIRVVHAEQRRCSPQLTIVGPRRVKDPVGVRLFEGV